MNHKEEFQKALTEYLTSTEIFTLWDEEKLTRSGEYLHLCFMKTYYKDGDETPYRLLAPAKCWFSFLEKLEVIFDSKINQKLVQRTIGRIVCELKEFPFTTEALDSYAMPIFERLWWHYQLAVEALVPVSNVSVKASSEIELANSILCSGGSNSLLMGKVNHPDIKPYLSIPENKSFLKIQVSGDDESRLRQVELEAEKALIVLRFVTMWLSKTVGTKRIKHNPASVVSIREQGERYIIYHRPQETNTSAGYQTDILEPLVFTDNHLEIAEHFGLKDLNYHHANLDNPVSRRIIRAIELYDNGVQSRTNWQTFYRYVVSINVVLPKSGSKGEDIVAMLTTLTQYGGSYIGSMKKDESADPETQTWDDMVRLTAKPFQSFYMLRGKILHGNSPTEEISDKDTEDIRVLAHNAIRLMAFLAREFNWQSDREAERWFKAPILPPSLEKPQEN